MMEHDGQSLSSCTPIGVVIGKESYDNLKILSEYFNPEITELEKNGLEVDGKLYQFEFFLCSDLKFLWMVLVNSFLESN